MKYFFSKLNTRDINNALIIILVIGLIIILRQYIDGRSFWLDEAFLGLNMDKSFKELLLPLEYNQSGPVLFLILSKSLTIIFGISDYSLRIIPLLAGLISIILIFLMSGNILGKYGSAVLLLLFILSERIIYYTNEFKHFAIDVLFSIIFLFFLTSFKQTSLNTKKFIIIGFTGILGVWISFSSILTLPVFICFPLYFYSKNKDKKNLLITLGMGVIWAVNIILNYIFILSKANLYRVASVKAYWSRHFVTFPLNNFHDIYYVPKAMKSFFTYITDTGFSFINSFPAIKIFYTYLFIALFILGIVILFIHKKGYLSIYILSIIALTIIASAAEKVPFIGRIVLFLAPLMLVSIAFGIEYIILHLKKYHRSLPIIFLVILFFIPAIPRVYYIIEPDNHSEMKSVINYYIENREPADKFYIEASNENKKYPQFAFYSDREFDFTNVDIKYYDELKKDNHALIEPYIKHDVQIKNELLGNKRVWVIEEFGTQRYDGELIGYFKEETLASRWPFTFLRDQIVNINDPSISIYLYSFE